jgi:hypothetical protein
VAYTTPCEALVAVRRVIAPAEAARTAVRGGLRATGRQQWTDQPTIARRHPQQRAPAGRRGEAIEHRLELVGGGVAGQDLGVARQREPAGFAVTDVARPGLEVAARRRWICAVHDVLDGGPLAESPHV